MNKILPFLFLSVICLACCTQTVEREKQQSSSIDKDIVQLKPYDPEVWTDYYLTEDRMDTIKVLLHSHNRKIDSVPIDSTMDWWCWYQQNDVSAVLLLRDVEPLELHGCGLCFCSALEEDGRRAIAIVPIVDGPSACTSCEIYEIKDKRWKPYKEFGTRTWCFDNSNPQETEFSKKYLMKRNGRWMYRDIDKIIIEQEADSTWHYVFGNNCRQ